MNSIRREYEKQIQKVEEKQKEITGDIWRQKFHLMPPTGWLNDPNGLCYFKNAYHVFFQYSPLSPLGGQSFWGHYKSEDLLHWEYLGVALYPDTPMEKDGAYSGSCLVEDGKMYLYYTGNVKEPGDHDYIHTGRQANTMLVETEDGIHFSEKKCLMVSEDYPSDLSLHVRDPKVWKEENTYYMVQGARSLADEGEVLLFSSTDKYHWELANRLKTTEKFGYMWECPDLFKIGTQTLLGIAPQGLTGDEWNVNQNVYQAGYFHVDGDYRNNYSLNTFTLWDCGFDFYAPQTFVDHKDRRILIGWMGMTDCTEYGNPTVAYGWQHCLTMPRVITEKNGTIYQNPPEEFQALRQEEKQLSNGQELLLESHAELQITEINNNDCSIRIANGIEITYRNKQLTMEFTDGKLGDGRKLRQCNLSHCSDLRIFLDASSIELYANKGEKVFSTRYYPKASTVTLNIQCPTSRNTYWTLK